MACNNCFNGCTEIVSDKCVRYTGVDIPALGISNGDTLASVEAALATFIQSIITGEGVTLDIDEGDYCELVSGYLPAGEEVTALNLFTALVKSACFLDAKIEAIEGELDDLEGNYTVDCLDGVSSNSGTHAILQATINSLCSLEDVVNQLAIDLDTNYVKTSELNTLIQAYLDSQQVGTLYKNRMVPYSIVPYFGSLSNFDATGAGTGEWAEIYLCNGQNGTPDLRGRVLAGAISGVPGGTLNSAVDPNASAFNPNYALGTTAGSNSVTLTEAQLPTHNHTITDPGHTHHLATNGLPPNRATLSGDNYISSIGNTADNSDYRLQYDTVNTSPPDTGIVENVETGISLSTAGGNQPHANNQPAIGTYFIMYIPS